MPPASGSSKDFKEISDGDWNPQVESIVATRKFVTAKDASGNFSLVGVSHKKTIDAGVNVADCKMFDNIPQAGHFSEATIPVEGCSCGWYAYDHTDVAWDTVSRYEDRDVVEVVVELSGKIIVCERGVKAQKLKLLAVALNDSTPAKFLRWLTENFPEVKAFDSTEEMLETFPLTTIDRPVATHDEPRGPDFRSVLITGLPGLGKTYSGPTPVSALGSPRFNSPQSSMLASVLSGEAAIYSLADFETAIDREVYYRERQNRFQTSKAQKIFFKLSRIMIIATIASILLPNLFFLVGSIFPSSVIDFNSYLDVFRNLPILSAIPPLLAVCVPIILSLALRFLFLRLSKFMNANRNVVKDAFLCSVPNLKKDFGWGHQ